MKIQALLDIEQQIVLALPNMAKAANDKDLKEGFLTHLEETKTQAKRLEEILLSLDADVEPLKCEGIRGIIKDGKWAMEQNLDDNLKDAMIAGAARYVEHYEMAGYTSAIEIAETLELNEVAETLNLTLEEEESTDEKLIAAMQKSLASK